METTIRSVISSPSTSDNEPRIAYIWMYVSWDRYRDTYLDIWVRRVIIIISFCYSSCLDICYGLLHLLLWFPRYFLLGPSYGLLLCLVFLVIVPVMTHDILWLFPLLVEIPVMIPDCWFMSFLFGIPVIVIVWFAILILYAWDYCGMRQWYIYEGFLVWIIPSTY